MATFTYDTGLCSRLLPRIAANPDEVRVPGDFADLSNHPAINKTVQRLIAASDLRHIHRGLYHRPRMNDLTGRPIMRPERQESSPHRVDGSRRPVDSRLKAGLCGDQLRPRTAVLGRYRSPRTHTRPIPPEGAPKWPAPD